MHSFRNGTDLWFKHLGLRSTGHGPHLPIDVHFVDKQHPIVKGLEDWTIAKDELYNNAEVFGAHALATGTQTIDRKNGKSQQKAIVVWTNENQGARSFSMSIGHYNEGVADDRYLNLVTRGLLWACDKLSPEYQKPFAGDNQVTFVKSKDTPPEQPLPKPKVMPKNATFVHVSASSTQAPNHPHQVLDGNPATRWCAENGSYPQWLQLEFETPQKITDIKITWEFEAAYRYEVLASRDGKQFTSVVNGLKNQTAHPRFEKLADAGDLVKWIRIESRGAKKGWCSIREVQFKGNKLNGLWPADSQFKPMHQPTPAEQRPDPNAKQGNVAPKIERLSADHEAAILKDVQVADGFEATLFAAPPAMNYPVFVAAAPDGTLYVSSDGNGSLGRDPKRGRVIRLRDLDGDGKADETKVFCNVDAPRGLVWDHDRLYLMHPPHLSAFIDSDEDGIADEQKVLVQNLAFGYDKRPADHTTNGLSLGVDGYLYIAGGDFGFMDAEGTDGRKLTHRGGGVIRVRPDGTGLEVYSTGTRNILEVAISPQMDIFARDNTNDGGGWNVRFHHFTGGDNHGYPRLYKNFPDECIAPLADYGGGSGCGAVFIDEPGFGQWNNAPFSADWGTGALFHHRVQPDGATFEETEPPQPLVRMTRPTDADVDGMSRLYCASWRGATFKWVGPNVGYIVQVRPKGFQPTPLPIFDDLSDDELLGLFDSPSYRRRLEAQRELVRRKNPKQKLLLEQGIANRTEQRNLVHRIQNEAVVPEVIAALEHADKVVQHVAINELASRTASAECFAALDRGEPNPENLLRALSMIHQPDVVDGLIARLSSESEPDRKQALLAAICRLHFKEGQWKGQSWGTRPDTRGPYYQPESWSETPRIVKVLNAELDSSDARAASFLVHEMSRNRIQSNRALERVVTLARKESSLVPVAVAQLANAKELTDSAMALLLTAATNPRSDEPTLANAIKALSKSSNVESIPAMFSALQLLRNLNPQGNTARQVEGVCLKSRVIQNNVALLTEIAKSPNGSPWADAALLQIASNKNASPEAKAEAEQAISDYWKTPKHQVRLIQAAARTRNHFLDDLILASIKDGDMAVSKAASVAAKQLKLKSQQDDQSPKLNSLEIDVAIKKATRSHGDIGHGELLFTKANCVACHTVSMDEKQKGPFLGNISKTYKRNELAASILQPSKTIAQGFKTNIILDVDGRMVTGYVTEESANHVMMRDSEGKEFAFSKDDIEARKESLVSSMPEGLIEDYTVHDLASILDYLDSLSEKNGSSKPESN